MSNRLKTTNSVSNEAIIDELTQDLEAKLVPGDHRSNFDEYVIDAPPDGEHLPSGSGEHLNKHDPNQDEDEFFDPEFDERVDGDGEESSDEKGDGDKEPDSEYVDEVALKDAELELTEDQKEERKLIADELKVLGNNSFKDEDFHKSIERYTEGLRTCPLKYTRERAILYCNRGAARTKLEKYKLAIQDCTKAVELDDKYVKAFSRRAQCYELTEKLDESLADYKRILELDPTHAEAQKSIKRLPPLIEERNEKLKNEMLGKLKDLGNMILKPFGLSTENFKLEQDGESKGYKINFKQ